MTHELTNSSEKLNIVEDDEKLIHRKKYPLLSENFYESLACLAIFDGLVLFYIFIRNPETLTLQNLGFISIFALFIPIFTLYLFTSRYNNFFENVADRPFFISVALFIQAGVLWYTNPEIALSLMNKSKIVSASLFSLWIAFPFLPRQYREMSLDGNIFPLPTLIMYFCLGTFVLLHAITTILYVSKYLGAPSPL